MSDVPDQHPLLRLPKPPRDFVADEYRPSSAVFEPSSEEKASAPVRVSVWDAERTSPSEAAEFRSERPLLVLRADAAAKVVAAGERIRVVYDPLTDADAAALPGADGHAGIEGLERIAGQPKVEWRAKLERVAAAFRLVDQVE